MYNIDSTVPQYVPIQMESVFNQGNPYSNNENNYEFEASDNAYEEGNYEYEYEYNEEMMEMELTNQLLSVSNEQEMDQFLGDLFKQVERVTKGAGKFINRGIKSFNKFANSKTGRQLGGMLKGIASKALPILGKAAGVGLAGTGLGPAGPIVGDIGASLLGQAFGLELEGLSPEDQEFQLGKQFVKLAKDAAEKAMSKADMLPPFKAAKDAVNEAARKFAPGLLSPAIMNRISSPAFKPGTLKSGTWHRKPDGSIIIIGL